MTIKEIARLASVSPATVSLVLNKRPGISPQTRKRVMTVIDETGYVIKPRTMQTMVQGSIRFVKYKRDGLLVERNGDFISRIMDGVEDTARSCGYHLGITNVSASNFDEMIDSINAENVDGIIFLGTEFDSEQASLLRRFHAPVVVVDNMMKNRDFDCVVMDNEAGVFSAISYLRTLGHTCIGHLKSAFDADNFRARKAGFDQALEHFSLEYFPEYTVPLTPHTDEAFKMMSMYIKQAAQLPTAFFADNDVIAIGAIRALKQAGVRVPEDISVVGFDDLQICHMIEPALTTIKIYRKVMGYNAVTRLVSKIVSPGEETIKMLAGTKLIIRQSATRPIR